MGLLRNSFGLISQTILKITLVFLRSILGALKFCIWTLFGGILETLWYSTLGTLRNFFKILLPFRRSSKHFKHFFTMALLFYVLLFFVYFNKPLPVRSLCELIIHCTLFDNSWVHSLILPYDFLLISWLLLSSSFILILLGSPLLVLLGHPLLSLLGHPLLILLISLMILFNFIF